MLGSRADVDDILQEAWLRWAGSDIERVQNAQAWLTTTVTRLCIDRLRAARVERDAYVGPWLPEPLVGEASPADRQAELASDLSVAFLVVLERLAPEERAAFLLHEVFDADYAEIARILGKGEAACRQIVHRARERVRRDRPRFQVSEAAHRKILENFIAAFRAGNHQALLALFAEDATWTSDGGGKTPAARKVLHGAARIAKLLRGINRLRGRALPDTMYRLMPINGELGIVNFIGDRIYSALSLDTDGVRIRAGYIVLNPEKLAHIAPVTTPRAGSS